ncbi:MFS transporter [Arthrobacter ginkgonis]|uniref:MFS transporter n=1 Tax=Arthrobacter ginkgonis TaxID=1630594 RepID=A0ABP7BUS1_9MICC
MSTIASRRTSAGAAVGFLVVMEFGSGILQGWLSPLFTSIGEQYGASAASLNWVSAAYLLATVLVVPLLSKLGDIYGHKRLLLIATIVVAAASILVAFAPNYGVFLAARAIQAPLAVFLPLEFAIVHQRDPENAGRSIGRLVGALTLGAAAGGLLSGAVLDATGSLTATLLVPALFMVLCIPGVAIFVKETTLRRHDRVDYLGALLLGTGLVAFLGGVSNMKSWPAGLTAATVLGGLALLVAWVVSARRLAHPLIDLRVLTHGGIGLPIVVAFLYGAQMFGSQTPISVYLRSDATALGYGFGASATTAGLTLSLLAVAAFVGATLSDRVARLLTGPRAVALGGAVSAIGYALMILAPGTLTTFTIWMVFSGLGAGVVIGALPTIVVSRAEPDAVGIASGLYNTARTAAGAVAGALFALLMAAFAMPNGSGASISTEFSFHVVWWICTGLCLLFAVLALLIRPRSDATAAPDTARTAADPEPAR